MAEIYSAAAERGGYLGSSVTMRGMIMGPEAVKYLEAFKSDLGLAVLKRTADSRPCGKYRGNKQQTL